MINTVLCALDISQENDEQVLTTANKIAKLENARLDIVVVVPNFRISLVGSYFDENFQNQAVQDAKVALKKRVADILGDDKVTDLRHIVASGSIYEEILETAEQAGADLIVIGAHKPELSDYLIGPNAARVVRHSKCSVYVVRES
ncbi:universal stress protein [uncultured Cohaesibacter sp.]|uniref:universal stress protein n=1 Tax=uncultured Cohaesibacter sp. TaxID=1002546 RepID=UPI0029C95E86|nr:universal stress protein [uncultured Cohaesibacter sp.]